MECPICYETCACVFLPCSHAFCKKCVEQWCKEKNVDTLLEVPCPMCRTVAQPPPPPRPEEFTQPYYPHFDEDAYFYDDFSSQGNDELLDSELDYGIEYDYFSDDSQPDSVS